MIARSSITLIAGLILAAPAATAPPASNSELLPGLSASATTALAASFRGVLVHMLPEPLYETSSDWGKTTRSATGLKWTGKGLRKHPHLQHAPRNDGLWRKVRVTADRPGETLTFELPDLRPAGPGKMTFTATMNLRARIQYDKQRWRKGLRLYAASVRARLRIRLQLHCELSARVELRKDALVPDAVFRLRVVRAEAGYDELVVEHVAGVGGDAAKLLGELVQQSIRRFDPGLEKKLLVRANAALEKAGDTKEVRLSLSGLWPH